MPNETQTQEQPARASAQIVGAQLTGAQLEELVNRAYETGKAESKKSIRSKVLGGCKHLWRKVRGDPSEFYGNWPFHNYPLDRFYSRPIFHILAIPKGYEGVRERFGTIGDEIVERNAQGVEINRYRGFPGGGKVDSGLRFMLSGFGALSRMAVVNTKRRTVPIVLNNVMTKGLVELPEVRAALDYRIFDPLLALTEIGDFKETTRAEAIDRIRSVINRYSLREFNEDLPLELMDLSKVGYGIDRNIPPNINYFTDLLQYGIEVQKLRLLSRNIPDELREPLAQRAIREATAEGRYTERVRDAQAARVAAVEHGRVATTYNANPGAWEVYRGEIAKEKGQGYVHITQLEKVAGSIADAITNIFGRRGGGGPGGPAPGAGP